MIFGTKLRKTRWRDKIVPITPEKLSRSELVANPFLQPTSAYLSIFIPFGPISECRLSPIQSSNLVTYNTKPNQKDLIQRKPFDVDNLSRSCIPEKEPNRYSHRPELLANDIRLSEQSPTNSAKSQVDNHVIRENTRSIPSSPLVQNINCPEPVWNCKPSSDNPNWAEVKSLLEESVKIFQAIRDYLAENRNSTSQVKSSEPSADSTKHSSSLLEIIGVLQEIRDCLSAPDNQIKSRTNLGEGSFLEPSISEHEKPRWNSWFDSHLRFGQDS